MNKKIFQALFRNKFPMIDFIGVISKTNTIQPAYADIKSQLNKQENLFKIKKINLHDSFMYSLQKIEKRRNSPKI